MFLLGNLEQVAIVRAVIFNLLWTFSIIVVFDGIN